MHSDGELVTNEYAIAAIHGAYEYRSQTLLSESQRRQRHGKCELLELQSGSDARRNVLAVLHGSSEDRLFFSYTTNTGSNCSSTSLSHEGEHSGNSSSASSHVNFIHHLSELDCLTWQDPISTLKMFHLLICHVLEARVLHEDPLTHDV